MNFINKNQKKEIKAGKWITLGHGELVHWFRYIMESSKDKDLYMKVLSKTNEFDEVKTTYAITPAGHKYASEELLNMLNRINKKLVMGTVLFPIGDAVYDELIMDNEIRYMINDSARMQIANSNTVKNVLNKIGA
jgi:hypothetical protein